MNRCDHCKRTSRTVVTLGPHTLCTDDHARLTWGKQRALDAVKGNPRELALEFAGTLAYLTMLDKGDA